MPLCFYLAGFGAGTPQQEAVPKGQEFSRIENLFVINRLANIRKYFKQKGFLGKIALTDNTMSILITGIPP